MLAFARPLLLAAGLAAALVPLLLHLLARRPPERAPLPTARFLAPDARTAVRLRRRPTDPLLLALRMLLLVLLGAAAAGPAWLPSRGGTAELVLLDRSAAMDAAAWSAAVAEARRALLAPDGSARGALLLFDSAAALVPVGAVTAARLDSLAAAGPGGARPDYAAALGGIGPAAGSLRGADSVRVTMLSARRWEGWRPGLSAVRGAAWPGTIRLPELPTATTPPSERADDAPRGTAAVHAAPDSGRYVAAALAATGWEVRAGGAPADAHFLLAPPDPAAAAHLRAALGAGATLVVATAASEALADLLPWEPAAPPPGPGGALVLDDGTRLSGAGPRSGGQPAAGARLLAAWEDGRPAAAARRAGRGCVVFVAADPEAGAVLLSAAFPRAVDRLARGCDDAGGAGADGAPLDPGARAVLRGSGPESVAVASLSAAGGGVSLGRWALGAALAVALIETVLAYGRRRRP